MGSEVDVLKLVSSLTLFREVARRAALLAPLPEHIEFAATAAAILDVAAAQGFPECRSTLEQLGSGQ
jgi:uncharacterized protein with von Willebrand factor type A (vWA) domain